VSALLLVIGAALPIADPRAAIRPGAVAVVLAGQSNAAGRGDPVPAPELAVERALALRKDGAFYALADPLDTPGRTRLPPGSSLAPTFAEALLASDRSVSQVLVIHCAEAESSIVEWAPAGALYARCLRLARAAGGYGVPVRAILWHQGESDARTAASADAYEGRLRSLIDGFRAELGPVPFVAGELLRNLSKPVYAWRSAVVVATRRATAELPACAYVTAEGLTDRGDQAHFDGTSQRALGRRYAAALAALRPELGR
jgi:hypothetical protein